MKKIIVISLADRKEETVTQLQQLGLLHIKPVAQPETNTASSVEEKIKSAYSALSILEEQIVSKKADKRKDVSGAELVGDVLSQKEHINQLSEKISLFKRELKELDVWGEFNPLHITELTAKGIFVKLYECPPQTMPSLPENCVVKEFMRTKHSVSFAVIAKEDFTLDIPEIKLPEIPPSQLKAQVEKLESEKAEIQEKLISLAGSVDTIQNYLKQLNEALEFATAHDQIGSSGILSYLQGFAPEEKADDFKAAAEKYSWGVVIEELSPEDNVPILIRNPRWLRPIEVVFNFIDTFPGYHEVDISPVFYLFFSLYYAMLIGDAGYGTLFLITTIAIHIWKGKVIPKQIFYLMYVLNISMIIWGVLTASYFGINLPEHAFLKKAMLLDTSDFGETVYFCFIIALAQLLIAHIWNIIRYINSWNALAEAGRAGIVVTMYYLANLLILKRPLPGIIIYVGIISIILAFVFSCIGKKSEELIGTIFQFPFSIINSFGDIASYIRLFAVGYASVATAQAFNSLALNVGFSNVFAGFFAALILVAGHALNMGMGFLAVLVHGLRLNMLEFSGHLGQEWGGSKYKPLKKEINKNINNK